MGVEPQIEDKVFKLIWIEAGGVIIYSQLCIVHYLRHIIGVWCQRKLPLFSFSIKKHNLLQNIQLFRERLSGKKHATRHCGWFWVLCFSKKFERIGTKGYGTLFASAKGKQQKKVRQLQSSGTVYWSYPILPFGIVACTFFRQPFSK